MINQIISFSIKNKLIIGLLTIALIVGGIWSMTQVPLDAVPDITNNQVQVITQAPNLGTEDIEQFVTYPIEVAVSNLPGVIEIRSISRFGLSVVTIVFEDDMGTYLPRQLVSEKLTELKEEIPEGFGKTSMGPITTGLGEVYQYTLKVDSAFKGKYSISDLRTMQDWIVQRQMAMVPGVIEVNAIGGTIKQYEVAVNPDELKAIGLTITDIFEALELNNENTGGAYIEKNHQANFIRGEGLARSLSDIEKIVVKTVDGIPIQIKDVAKVQYGSAVRYGALTQDGEGEVVGGLVMMLKGANSNEVVENVKERMAQIQQSLPEGVVIEPILDRSELISDTTGTVATNLIEGALIVIFVLVFLLGNWRGGLIVASTIPLSLLFAFILMNIFDVWANLMSLGAIDFGIIVDGAVIIVEGTVFFLYQRMRKGKEINAKERDETTYTASSKMMNAAFFGQLIILIVFIPILFLEGVEGKMFKPMAFTFMFAMMGAMILCLTYVPMISSLFIRVPQKEKKSWGDKIVIWLEDKYEKALGGVLKRTAIIIGSSVVLFALAIFTFTRMGGEFIPQLDEGDIAFHAILKPGSSLSETIETTTKIERIVKSNFPEVEKIVSRIGVAEVPTDPMPFDFADVFVILKPEDEWVSASSKEELVEKMKEKVSLIPGVNFEFTQPIEMRFNELLEGVREDVAIKLYGEDISILAEKAQEVSEIIEGTQGIGDMRVEATTGLPQITIKYERDELAQYGMNISYINNLIQTAFAGGKAGVIFEGEKRFDLVVRLDSAHRTNIDDLKNLYINTPNGTQIPLREVANISYEPGPMQISRDNTNRRIYVGVNVRGRDVKSLVQEIQQKLNNQLELPAGYYIRYGGAFENLERATARLKVVVPIALALIFILIFFALRSFKQTAMIYIAIPLAAIGGVFSLWLRDMPFSISAGIGFIVLFGVAVLNGLVLISGWNKLKEEGVTDLGERIRQGARRRIRPIMLTALTDVLGFLPMAISTSAGAEVQRPLATVVIGGMISATLLTLFVLPILYRWTETRSFTPSIGKSAVIVLLIGGFSMFAVPLKAQQADSLPAITIEEAVNKAIANYPKIKSARLKIEQQETLKKTAWNLGNTQIFTEGEEIEKKSGRGVYTTIGIQQQNIDIFSIAPKLKVQKQKVVLAEAALNLSELELMQQVKQAYAAAYIARKNLELYNQLDSVYQEFQKAAQIRYEVEETSRLAYLAASNQVKQVTLQKEQMEYEYITAVGKLNLWLVSDTLYTVTSSGQESLTMPLLLNDSISTHPILQIALQQIKVTDAERKAAIANLLPKLNAQYGAQKIEGQSGFYQFRIGVSIPLSFLPQQGRLQSAKIQQQIAEQEYRQTQFELQAGYQSLLQQYRKWLASWRFYEDEALPLAREQRQGAVLAYKEGAIDYVSFIQNLKEAVQVEVKAQEALNQYLESKFQLEYYLNTSNK
ncbi:CusA/CzcA family heavy metal efflux RND transporter [Cecembia calidifontis]|uniref:Cobalt-zinc-cadmium resistance protein CzcA n=1 Tax=Cecembia calidifontis TaxID=1187080 RepID=A0A4Q7PCS7_9BACT|nr:CusA/CzcA family heavy metal efflux RND transporter [Cecembia calidifontis]RZS97528.1 cobalt-zinc-cadmium resistance protein CzcA [Cecembia calidifontis]